MDTITSLCSLPLVSQSSINASSNGQTRLNVKSSLINFNSALRNSANQNIIKVRELKFRAKAVDEVAAAVSDPTQTQLTWEIIVGSLAGVIPFIVAGIEFNKRIVAQRKCEVCGGSGLVLRDKKYYFRCPSCGGFLPWQSWRRFFTG